MANLNLSQFTEKLFVADADHTFIWDTAGAISKRVSRNSWLSGTTADFHLGLADAASPVAQTISVQSVVAGTSNTAGANLSINGSQGTGTGAGGSLLLRTAPAGSSGTAQNALVTAVAITSAGNVGIGTTSPTSKLHVDGNALFGQNTTSATLTPLKVSFGGTYGTSTAGSRANLKWEMYNDGLAANSFGIGMSLGLMEFQAGNGSGFAFYPNNSLTSALTIAMGGTCTHAGNLIFTPDNTYDIGASGANRPRNVYVGTNVISRPAASITPANNGEFVVEATSNTTLTFKLKGTDGTVRSGTITLA